MLQSDTAKTTSVSSRSIDSTSTARGVPVIGGGQDLHGTSEF
jgi:hypothetical protein